MSSLRALCLLLWFLASCAMLASASAPASISTPACDKSGSVVNDIKGVPRLNAAAKVVSSDLGSYAWYTCTGANSSGDCSWYNPFEGGVQISNFYGGTPAADSPENALQGYGVLVAFAIVMAVLSVLIGLSICVGRYCCCCIRGGTCGKRWPTVKTRCCGIQPNLVSGRMEYSPRERWCARGYMWTFVTFTVVWLLMSYFAGTGSIPNSMKAIANAPEPLIQTLQGLSAPIRDLIVDLSTQTAAQLVQAVQWRVRNTTDLDALVDDMTCIVNLTGPGKLPNTTVLSNVITALADDVAAINATLAGTSVVLAGVNAQIANVTGGVVAIEDDTWIVGGSIADGIASLRHINDSLNVLAVLSSNISDPTSGAPSISHDLASSQSGLPNATAVSDATRDLTYQTATDPSEYAHAQTEEMQALLASIDAKYAASPDYAATAAHLAQLQADVDEVNRMRLFEQLNAQVDDAQYAIWNVSAGILAINQSINDMAGAVASFNFSAPTALLLRINGSAAALPAVFALLQSQLGLVRPLLGVLPCFDAAVGAAEAFNVTLIQLPSEFDSVIQLGPQLNSTLTSALTTVDAVQTQIVQFDYQLGNFSVTVYLQQIATMKQLAADQVSSLTAGADVQELNSAYAQMQAANFSGVAQLMALNSSMNSIAFNATLVDTLILLQQAIDDAEALMAVIIPDLQQINTHGYCSDSGVQCIDDSHCTAPATCASAPGDSDPPKTQRCAANGATNCTTDAQCGATDRCLVDAQRYTWLRDNITLVHFATPDADQVTTLNTQLTDVDAQTDSQTNGMASVQATIDDTIASLSGVKLSGVNATLQSLQASLTTFDTAGVQAQVSTVQAALGAVDLSSAQSTVNSLSSSIDEVNSDLAQLVQAQQLVSSIRDLLWYQLPLYLTAIDEANLLADYSAGGLSAMATSVLQLVDNATAFLNNSQFIAPTDLATTVLTSDIRHYLDVLSTPAYSQYGPVYFIAMLAYKDKTLDLSTYPSTGLARYNEDASGHSYANGSYCLSSACIDSTIDYYTGTDLKTVSSGSIPVGLSALHALSIPLVVPAVIALLGLLSTAMYRSAAWASCCSSCTACLIFVAMPVIFVLAGLVWPLLVVGVADACSGGVSIGNQYVTAQAPSLCTDTLSGTLTPDGQCYVSPATNVSFTFDIAAVYASIAGSSCSAAHDPMAGVFTQLAQTVASYPLDKIDDAIDTLNDGSSSIRIRQPLITIAQAAARSSGALFTTAIDSVGDQLGCAPLSASFEEVKAAFCCTTATTFYWAVGAWYLMAFSMLLCGWQAALLGRKRFANQIWGPGMNTRRTACAGADTRGLKLCTHELTQVYICSALVCVCNAQQRLCRWSTATRSPTPTCPLRPPTSPPTSTSPTTSPPGTSPSTRRPRTSPPTTRRRSRPQTTTSRSRASRTRSRRWRSSTSTRRRACPAWPTTSPSCAAPRTRAAPAAPPPSSRPGRRAGRGRGRARGRARGRTVGGRRRCARTAEGWPWWCTGTARSRSTARWRTSTSACRPSCTAQDTLTSPMRAAPCTRPCTPRWTAAAARRASRRSMGSSSSSSSSSRSTARTSEGSTCWRAIRTRHPSLQTRRPRSETTTRSKQACVWKRHWHLKNQKCMQTVCRRRFTAELRLAAVLVARRRSRSLSPHAPRSTPPWWPPRPFLSA